MNSIDDPHTLKFPIFCYHFRVFFWFCKGLCSNLVFVPKLHKFLYIEIQRLFPSNLLCSKTFYDSSRPVAMNACTSLYYARYSTIVLPPNFKNSAHKKGPYWFTPQHKKPLSIYSAKKFTTFSTYLLPLLLRAHWFFGTITIEFLRRLLEIKAFIYVAWKHI